MAQKSQGIQQLLQAEKKAADLIAEARKKKSKRAKQAKEEAISEIEAFRGECEKKFQDKQKHEIGQEDFKKQINEESATKLDTMVQQCDANKDKVIERMLQLVYDIQPELHENFRSS
ncbi:V-type proton ATPase subunit G 1-like [Clytia hemisphaerica]|uniref:V-type proton ATPase subunit G 1-like n=1 Tax=Clytia hemisphaerica TaxID=252671 RepID=UPI0034D4E33A